MSLSLLLNFIYTLLWNQSYLWGANVLDYQNFDGLWDEVLWVTGQLHFNVLRCTSLLYIRGHVNLWVRVTHNILEH